ncbi:hypothetical protein HUN03_00187 [Mycoplasmopsis anatis]|uniref:Lipoprotein n=1 Tax=Mycoplasmopsis anatis TaxID=171279 RepID=A0A9Q3LAH6_9BACT|nr:hypothetical protein [Mycoplasmopsis anatis]MBW0594572.1 hypothetical protein [Mycoplasmopsis anatis]MBW0595374.1 hypothetical protein [Mycoplasmopsis anatis]MBW0596259.1 hypothetical protein [Mycoplasmopsis anatis]MBW0596999.1 hypothetical protein [Mycoplasmopsis anatis]MBW0597291.1 hypothetical protein [Mycoplasmopsis anatis]
MKLKKHLFSVVAFVSFLSVVSCQYIGDIKDKRIYIKSFNFENTLINDKFSLNSFNKIDNDTESLLFSPLISYNYYDKMIYDNVNNEVKQSTKKYLKLNLIDGLILEFSDNTTQVYNNNSYNDFNQISKNEPIIKLSSSDVFSINNKDFFNNLNKAKKIKFLIKNINYVNKDGEPTKYKLKAKDFIVNLNNSTKLLNLLENYGIQFSIENDMLIINSSKELAGNFIFEQMIQNMIFNPISTEFLEENNISINMYKPTLEQMLFLSNYVLNKNSIDKQVFIKNKHSADVEFNNSDSTLNKIILNFNSTPLDDETFRLQTFKSFRQALVSEADLSIFNTSQIENIKNNSSIYGLQPKFINISNTNINKLILNYDFNQGYEFDFNDTFSKIIYGDKIATLDYSKAKEFFFSNTNSILFRNFIFNSINVNEFIKLTTGNDYWLSVINPFIDISDQHSSYKKLTDSYNWVNQQYIFNNNLTEMKTINPIDYKYYQNSNLLIDYEELLKSPYYEYIKKELNELISKFNLETNEKISFTIPFLHLSSFGYKQIYSNLEKIINGLNEHISVKFKEVDLSYFNKHNTFITYSNIEYINNSYIEAIKKFDKNALKSFVKNSEFAEKFKLLSILKKLTNENQADFDILLSNFVENLTSLQKAKLISELGFVFNSFVNTTNSININNFSYEIVQNDYIKPINDLGYEHFPSIRIK